MRLALRIVKWVGIVLVAGVAVLALYVWQNWDREWDVPAPELHATTDPAVIARGEYLVFGPAHCMACHIERLEEYQRYYSSGERPALTGGFAFLIGPLGTLYSRNITPDPETGIGRYTDPQLARLLRHGVKADGRVSIPEFMPYGNMSDDDIVAVLSFLRAQAPVRKVVPENEWTLFGKVMKTFVSAMRPRIDVNPPATAPAQAPTPERGEYLAVSVANCGGCHTPFDMATGAPTGPSYSGGNPMEPVRLEGVDPSLWFQPPNITPLAGSAFSKFPDQATFVARFQVGGRKDQGSPMPWEAFSRMTPEDLAALYEFLKSVPPSGSPAPAEPTVPPPS